MTQMLSDYKDKSVCEFLEFGFPLDFEANENEIPSHDQIWKYRNHRGATDFAKEINAFLEKENKTIQF